MGRRKMLLVIVVIGLMVLFLSPWNESPVPVSDPTDVPDGSTAPLPAAPIIDTEEDVTLKVTAVASEADFELLQEQSSALTARHPDVGIEWERIDPGSAGLADSIRDGARHSDIVYVPNEWVRHLAVNGLLLPADAAYIGEAQSEQFTANVAQMKWNAYLWGVPVNFDPYVVVWNTNVLEALRQDNSAAVYPPLSPAQWQSLPKLMADKGLIASWLAIDDRDPMAFLGWLGAATGHREDAVFDLSDPLWTDGTLEGAMALLAEERAGISLVKPDAAFWPAFAAGRYAATVVRQSVAKKALATLSVTASSALRIDRSAWETPFVWPGGASFAMTSATDHEDVALLWMSEMTEKAVQKSEFERSGRMPAYRSLFEGENGVLPELTAGSSRNFPNQPSLATEPDVAAKLSRIGELWSGWLAGRYTFESWKASWSDSLADSQADD